MTDWPRFVLLGVPWDASSSFLRGAADGPQAIREALWSPSTNTSAELGIAIEPDSLEDAGDLALDDTDQAAARAAIESAVRGIRERGGVPIVFGGDHSVTYPVLRAYRESVPATVLHFDAHGDLYDNFQGDRYSHACPFARVMEERLTGRLVQIGIRTATEHLRAQAIRFGVQVYGMDRWRDAPIEALRGPLYVSLDLDGLDPAFAPGVAHPEPGGLSTREVIDMLHRIRAPIAGIDIVELNPRLDVRDLTARVAAKLLKELTAVAVRNHARR